MSTSRERRFWRGKTNVLPFTNLKPCYQSTDHQRSHDRAITKAIASIRKLHLTLVSVQRPLASSTSRSLQPAPIPISHSISESMRQFPLLTKDPRRTTGQIAKYSTFVTYNSDVTLTRRRMRARDLQVTAIGLHFIMMMIYKKASRMRAVAFPVCFVLFSSQVPLLPFPLLLFFTVILLSRIGSLPLPELPTSL